jgi:hypothetical protein
MGSLKVTATAGQAPVITTPAIATLQNQAQYSISWFQEVDVLAAGATGLFLNFGSGQNPGVVEGGGGSLAELRFQFRKGSGAAGIDFTVSPSDAGGHHYAIVWDSTGANTAVLYRNGGALSTLSAPGTSVNTAKAVAIPA